MTTSEVKASEDQQLLQEKDGALYYTDTLADMQMYVVYRFGAEGKQLQEGQYILQEELPKPAQYVQAYKDVKSALADEYGEARIDTTLFQSKKYMNKPDQYPAALQEGQIRFQSVWDTEDTQIVAQLWNGQQIRLAVQYVSKAHKGS